MQLSGFLSLSTNILPTIMNLLKRLADEGQRPAPATASTEESSTATSSENGDDASNPIHRKKSK